MIKKLLVSTVALATLSTAVMADKYAGAGLAVESVDGLDSGISLVLNGGMTLDDVLDDVNVGPGTLAVEGEFSYSVIAPSYSTWWGSSIDVTYMTLGAYAAYIYDINKEFYVKPRAGLTLVSGSVSGGGSVTDDGIKLAVGVGGGYKLNKQMNVFADLNMISFGDMMHLTAGVEYHF